MTENNGVEEPTRPGTSPEEIRTRDLTFAQMFDRNERVWLIGEEYHKGGPVWRVDFLSKGQQGQWMVFRYHYDVPTGVIYFMGARPVADESELTRLRRQGRVFRPTATEDG